MAFALRSTLDQALLLVVTAAAAEDSQLGNAQSFCYANRDEAEVSSDADMATLGWVRQCKVWGEEGSVLFLPCGHLCLCKECERMAAACLICCSMKNATMEILLC
ncbi:SBP (S-ribonuclease binding protein) family protein [Rhynchospora pubera]|nr:SBP (S-ribonuclease binding protein) family protein [Rhynchospora pubera]